MNMMLTTDQDSTYIPEDDATSISTNSLPRLGFESHVLRPVHLPLLPLQARPSEAQLARESLETFRALSAEVSELTPISTYRNSIREAISAVISALPNRSFTFYAKRNRPRIAPLQRYIVSSEDTYRDITLARLRHLSTLGENWDTYGGATPSNTAIASAYKVLEFVGPYLTPLFGRSAQPTVIAPLSDGGVLLEWRTLNSSIEVEADEDGELSLLQIERVGDDESFSERENVPLSEILSLIVKILDS